MLTKITITARKDGRDVAMYSAYSDVMAARSSHLVFLSIVMPDSKAKSLMHDFRSCNFFARTPDYYIDFDKKDSVMESQKVEGGYQHIMLRAHVDSGKHTSMNYYIFRKEDRSSFYLDDTFTEIPQDVIDQVSECIMEHTSIPFIKEWGRYICRQAMQNNSFSYINVDGLEDTDNDYGFKSIIRFDMKAWEVERWLRTGLRNRDISIDGCSDSSETFRATGSISNYLNNFGTILADQTTKTFHPAFDPTKEEVSQKVNDFFDLCEFYIPEVVPYKKQKHVIEAGRRCLKNKNSFLISGEPGSGKTIMAIGTVATSAWRPDYSVALMVPPGLVTRWEEAITKTVPMSDVRIVTSMREFMDAVKEIKNPLRMRSLWVIMSNNVVKADYDLHPAVIWSEDRHCYVCPHCGRPIVVTKMRFDGEEDNRRRGEEKATAEDFLREPDEGKLKNKNLRCERVIGPSGDVIDGCGAKLWTASTKGNSTGTCNSALWNHPDDAGKSWTKIPNLGWIQRDRIEGLKQQITEALNSYNAENIYPKKVRTAMEKALKAMADFDAHGASTSYPMRYSIARYLKKHYNKAFDFGIFDEVHQLTGDSQQGRAFADITNGVKKSIFLTGTLSKGYPKDMFYLLFRTQTRKMIEGGYSYDSLSDFNKAYGVEEHKIHDDGVIETTYSGREFVRSRRRTTTKMLPGISPTLVADYLMDNMASVSQADIRTDLRPYNEYPVGIEMDDELALAYQGIIENVVTTVSDGRGGTHQVNRRAVKNALSTADMFLDQPYGLDTTRADGTVVELSPDPVRPKEQKLIEICKDKKEKGEKMLIYVQWTGKLDIINRLSKLLEDNGVHAIGFSTRVKINERQKWLQEQANDGVDAVILNPELVNVGLNLLDYTTIIFYEIGNKLPVIRQAKDRSKRINQEHPVSVYFLYYKNTIQEDTLGLISQKLKAAKAMEGDFTESALQEIGGDTDILTKLVNSIVKNEHIKVSEENFEKTEAGGDEINSVAEKMEKRDVIHFQPTNFLFAAPEEPQYLSMCA